MQGWSTAYRLYRLTKAFEHGGRCTTVYTDFRFTGSVTVTTGLLHNHALAYVLQYAEEQFIRSSNSKVTETHTSVDAAVIKKGLRPW